MVHGLVAIALLTTTLHAQTPRLRSGQATTPDQQVIAADDARFAAMLKSDVAALEKILAPELTYIHSSAQIQDKHALLYDIKSGDRKYSSIIPTERKVHAMGTTAVLTGISAVRGTDHGNPLDVTVRYTAVYVLREARWQLVSFQATRIVPSDKVIPGGPA